jgi:acyl carrier protein
MENELRKQLMLILKEKLTRLNIRETELGDSFDLVKSGLLNSLEFVDMVASLEKAYELEIDFEEGLNSGELTTIGGLSKAFLSRI